MTAPYKETLTCECGKTHTVETEFNRWMRNHPQLDSREAGIMRFDCDVLLHRYKLSRDGIGERTIQCMMFIEVKTWGKLIEPGQQDTLSKLNQILRNRKKNMHSEKIGRHLARHVPPAVAVNPVTGKKCALRLFGGHLLVFQKSSPRDSSWIEWDRKRITTEQLVSLLRFDIDPDKLTPIDHRRRYRSTKTLCGYQCNECNAAFDIQMIHCPLCEDHYPTGTAHHCK